MCLKLNKWFSFKRTARRNITVYKKLVKEATISKDKILPEYHGKDCIATINNTEIEGKFVIDKGSYHNHYFICHNNDKYNGTVCKNKLGYKYSWNVDGSVISLKIEDIELIHNEYRTEIMSRPVEIGNTYISEVVKVKDYIEEGLHSFVNLKDARKRCHSNNIIVECTIPKGSKYYVGKYWLSYDESCKSIASTQLRYNKIVN